ncbi:hypothetical protein IWX50DRAFT_618410 [Phyllosticta citricarpa]|uniref:Uncharacterized protein n=1 Tax=Phyllosticta citricarpa TaxID=55181 RepID=A0ABR1LRR1_9PEZI
MSKSKQVNEQGAQMPTRRHRKRTRQARLPPETPGTAAERLTGVSEVLSARVSPLVLHQLQWRVARERSPKTKYHHVGFVLMVCADSRSGARIDLAMEPVVIGVAIVIAPSMSLLLVVLGTATAHESYRPAGWLAGWLYDWLAELEKKQERGGPCIFFQARCN